MESVCKPGLNSCTIYKSCLVLLEVETRLGVLSPLVFKKVGNGDDFRAAEPCDFA